MKEEAPKKKGGGAPDWMVTFSDLMTLLLTFFVLLLSTAEVSKPKFERAVNSLQSALAGINIVGSPVSSFTPITMPNPSFKENDNTSTNEKTPLDQTDASKGQGEGQGGSEGLEQGASDSEQKQTAMIFDQLMTEFEKQLELGMMELEKENDKIMIRFPSDATFTSGSANLSGPAVKMIRDLGSMLSGFYVEMKASGFTDSIPIKSSRFRSNHELSASRAVSVVQELKGAGNFSAEELLVVGHGEGTPLATNSTPQGRSVNRRVELEINPSSAKLSAQDLDAFSTLDSLKGIQKAGQPLRIDMSRAKNSNRPAMTTSPNTTLEINSSEGENDIDQKLQDVIGGNEVSNAEKEREKKNNTNLRNTGSRRTVYIATEKDDENLKENKVITPSQLTGKIDSMNKGKFRIKK